MSIDFTNQSLKTRRCSCCNEEKIWMIYFSEKGSYCKECVKEKNKVKAKKMGRDPKNQWRGLKIGSGRVRMFD